MRTLDYGNLSIPLRSFLFFCEPSLEEERNVISLYRLFSGIECLWPWDARRLLKNAEKKGKEKVSVFDIFEVLELKGIFPSSSSSFSSSSH